ncbi:MAG TPA: error-prone DNA polymerase [Vicinamibacterales bacterium]|nr:error-prone DNA polymerase [Vicinamibacterales bacterium]
MSPWPVTWPVYIELHTSSAFSFLRAASLPETLIDRAAMLGYPAVALLDRDGVSGAPRFHKAALAAGIKPLIGAELTIDAGLSQAPHLRQGYGGQASPKPHAQFSLPVLCSSQEGWRNLCRLLSKMKLRAPKGEGALAIHELDGYTTGLVAMPGRPLLRAERFGVGGLLDRIVGMFGRGNTFVEIQRHLHRDQEDDNDALVCLAGAFRVPLLATGGVAFATPEERPLFDVVTSIREHVTLMRAGRRLAANAERYLKPAAQMARLFADRPGAVHATRDLADRLQFTMQDLGYRFPKYPIPDGETESSFLRQLAEVGARNRYRPYHDRARAQVARELDLIEKLELAGYFLIVWDIVNFCRQQNILVQGRGSAANSAVCYSLGITAVDPVGMELLFERFLSEERGEWPDIDLDLPSGDRREEVIQHVYKKYGQHGAAMTANVITYRGKSAAREVGKALDLDEGQIDRLAKVMHQFEFIDPTETLANKLAEVGMAAHEPRVRHFAELWRQIQDLPRHLGQHSGGMVVCQGELSSVVPLENASMPGRVIVQWDKEDCADMGLIKVDLLGLGMMAVLQDTLALINTRDQGSGIGDQGSGIGDQGSGIRDQEVTLASLPPDDPQVYEMLRAAETIGVFQVESRAQMATLPRMRPEKFYDLVVEVALIRPGPIVGQMVHPYLSRRAGREEVKYDHPLLEPILKRTLGVPLFQEQLLRMAMAVAGFTGGQAEDLRRAMGFKRSEKRMKQLEGLLREGMAKHGITGEVADRIVLSITSFALYGFPESHAASFALLAYASAYFKMHYPAAFFTALLNNQPMGFYHPATLVKDAQRRGVRFNPIDVQVSDWDCTVEPDGAVRLGLRYVRGMRADAGKAIAKAEGLADKAEGGRQKAEGNSRCPKCGCDDPSMLEMSRPQDPKTSGPLEGFCNVCSHQWNVVEQKPSRRFRSIDDLVRRVALRRDEIAMLAEIGALNSLGHDRRSAMWQVERAIRPGGEMFTALDDAPHAPHAPYDSPLEEMNISERLIADYTGTGLTVGPHPLTFRRRELAMRGVIPALDLPRQRAGRRVRTAGMVITRQRPGTAKGFVFLTLEDETGISNIIIRPDLYAAERLVVVESSFLLVEGILQNQDGVTSIKAERMSKLHGMPDEAAIDSHDFH